MSEKTLEQRLIHRVRHRLPDFERLYELGAPDILAFEPEDCRDWHRRFVDRIFDALDHDVYLPVFRISHGEFIMAVGYRVPPQVGLRSRLGHIYATVMRQIGRQPIFYSGSSDNSYETFTKAELSRAQQIYQNCLRGIAKDGLLAIAFNENSGYIQYIKSYMRWLDCQGISVHRDNYFPFYSVYALFFGADSLRLFNGRNILVITSLTPDKKLRIDQNLQRRGVASVQYYPVSSTKAMFDHVDLSSIRSPIDLVLIGAGVGASAILEQVKPLKAVSIDSGFALDALAFPEKRWNRPFCIQDTEFDPHMVNFLDVPDIEMHRAINEQRGENSALLDTIEKIVRSKKKLSAVYDNPSEKLRII